MKRDRPAGLTLVRPIGPEPLLRAEVVWRHALEATDPADQHDLLAVVLELARTARHDVATMAEALSIGRLHVSRHPTDLVALRSTGFIEQALVFMGADPKGGHR